jgi:hypothetical protein
VVPLRPRDGDLSDNQASALERHSDLLEALEITPMTKSFKMLVLLTMLNRDRFPGEISVGELVDRFSEMAERSAKLEGGVGPALASRETLQELIENNPVKAWGEGRGTGGAAFFDYRDGVFSSTIDVSAEEREGLQELVRELVEWRLAEYLQRAPDGGQADERIVCKVSHAGGRPIIFLDRNRYPHAPEGWTNVTIEGESYRANFVKVAVNVIQRADSKENELPALIRGWFGP